MGRLDLGTPPPGRAGAAQLFDLGIAWAGQRAHNRLCRGRRQRNVRPPAGVEDWLLRFGEFVGQDVGEGERAGRLVPFAEKVETLDGDQDPFGDDVAESRVG